MWGKDEMRLFTGLETPAALCAASLVLAGPQAAHTQILDEIKFGVMAHDVSDLGNGKESHSADGQVELDTARPGVLRWLGAPRVNAVLALNSAGKTNFGAMGLTWDRRLFSRLYGRLDLGMGLTDGVTDAPPGAAGGALHAHRLILGSKALFREAIGVDWRLTGRWSIGAAFEHLSNGGLLGNHYNEGINDVGMTLSYRFK